MVGTKYALLTDAELDSLRHDLHDDDVLGSNQLFGWVKQPADLVRSGYDEIMLGKGPN